MAINQICKKVSRAWRKFIPGKQRRQEQAIRRLIDLADRNPHCSVGHAVEHVVPELRELL